MQKNDLIRGNETILRILAVHENKVLVVDCVKRNMPQWVDIASVTGFESCTELDLSDETNMELIDLELLDPATRKTVHERFTIIAGILPFVSDDKMRSILISKIAEEHNICKQTVRNYLFLYHQERGAHDYRKDACITLDAFETIVLHCIIYYNSQRIIDNFPYSEEMLSANIPPHASDIWNWGMAQPGANLIAVSPDELLMTLLPRTTGTFTRYGLKVNQMRYAHDGYTEAYLNGGNVTVAYNPDDVSCVWLLNKGSYIPFYLIETRFNGLPLEAVEAMQTAQKGIIKDAVKGNMQAKIDLTEHIKTIANGTVSTGNAKVKSVRETRKRAQRKAHKNIKVGESNA